MRDLDDEAESEVLRDVRWLADQMHPAELVVRVVRGEGWGTDPGGVFYVELADGSSDSRAPTGGGGEVELYFDDGADTSKRVTRAEYLGALADVCLERGYPDEHDVIRAVLADPAHAKEHPAHDLARAAARCARLAELLEAQGWERRGDELHHVASGSAVNTRSWNAHVEALRAELDASGKKLGADARPEWLAYQRSMLAAIDALLAEERRDGRRPTTSGG